MPASTDEPGLPVSAPPAAAAARGAEGPALLRYLVIGALLRLLLSWVNTEANDDHLVVMREIVARGGSPPGREACWECYHAKLYHYMGAAAYALTGLPMNKGTVRLANLIAAAAGLGCIGLLLRCARRGLGATDWRPDTRRLGYAFFALWPALIVISSQATNDSFVILFCTAALYFLHRFFGEQRPRDGAAAIAFMILAASSKASGWIFFLVSLALIAVKAAVEAGPRRRRALLFGAACLLGFLPAVCLQHPYREYLRDYGTPFKGALKEDRAVRLPHFFEKTSYSAPGVLSVFDAFFTFRFVDMLAHPTIENGPAVVPRHRSCFWSQLYGRAFFTRFDQWPPTWQTHDRFTMLVGRACLLLGLAPALVLLTGIGLSLRRLAEGLRREGPSWLARDHDWIFPVYLFAFVGMVAMFALLYRGYSWIKVIYFLPALLALFKLFLDGLDRLVSGAPRAGPWILRAQYLLLFLFNVDTLRLIFQLAWNP